MISRKVKLVAGIVVSLALVLSLTAQAAALTPSQVTAIVSLLQSFGADAATVANVTASLNGQPTSGTVTTTTGTVSGYNFAKDLTVGSRGADVTALQNLLGVSPTGYFGALTKAAVMHYQLNKGISPAAGYVGAKTRAVLNSGSTTTTTTTTTTTGTTNGTDLAVTLAPSSPASSAIVAGQSAADLVEYTFTNRTATPAVVTNITLARGGVSADTTLANVYLYNGAVRLTDAATVSSGKVTFNSSAGLFTVPAGSSVTVSVKADITSGTSGQLISISLTGVTSNVPVSAVYPISGAAQNVFSSSDIAMATSTLSTGTLAGGTIQAGSFNQSVWSTSLNISGRAVYLKSLALKVIGSIPTGTLQNINLFVSGTQVATANGVDSNGMVTFDMSAQPYKIDSSRTLEVRADVVKGSSRTFTLSLQNASDLQVIDSNYNVGLAVNLSGVQSSGTWLINGTTGGSVTVTLDPTLSSGNIITGASNVPLARYTMKAYGEDMKISYLQASSTKQLDNVALYANGIQVGSTQTIGTAGAGKLYNLGSSLIIPAGTSVTLEIRGDIKYNGTNLSTTANTVAVALAGYASNAQGQESSQLTTVPAVAGVVGPTMTVTSATVTLSTNAAYASAQTVVPNTSGVKLGSYTISAGSAEDVRVTQLTVTLGGAAGVTTNVSNLYVAVSGSTPTTPVNPNASNTFTVNFTVPANSSKTIDVYGDLSSVQGVASTTLALQGYGVSSNATITKTAVTGQSITAGSGTLATPTLRTGSGYTPDAQLVVGGSTSVIAYYNATSTNGSATISELYFDVVGSSVTNGDSPITGISVGGVPATINGASSTVTGLNITVPQGYAGVDIPVTVTYANVGIGGVTSNKTVGLTLTGMKFTSGNTTTSTTTLSVTDASNYQTLVSTKPTISIANPTTSSVGAGGVVEVADITVTADAAGPVKILAIPLSQIATGSGSATTTTVKVNGTAIGITDGFLTSVGTTTAATGTLTFTTPYQIAAGSSVTFQIWKNVTLTQVNSTVDTLRTTLGSNSLFSWSDINGNVTVTGSAIHNYPTDTAIVSY